MTDSIKLAEDMGWTPLDLNLTGWWMPPGVKLDDHIFHINRVAEADLPDPFTDANDDYAVLEWMRKQSSDYMNIDGKHYGHWLQFKTLLNSVDAVEYQIGDYARAVLKVIE